MGEPYAADSVGALLIAYRRSTEFAQLSPQSKALYERAIAILSYNQHLPLHLLTRRALLDLRDAVVEDKGSGAANHFMAVTKTILVWAINRERLTNNPAQRIKPLPGGHWEAWTYEQAQHALATFREPLRRVVVLGLYTGQRRHDLITLPWAAYDGTALAVRQQKTGVELVIPAAKPLRAELDSWQRISPVILTDARGIPWTDAQISIAMRRAVVAVGLPAGLSLHGLRKLAAVELTEAGCSTAEVMAICGWKSVAMVELYTRSVSQRKLANAAIIKLDAKNRG